MLMSFVFSFRNEEENIPELVRRVSEVAKSIDDLQHVMEHLNVHIIKNKLGLLNLVAELGNVSKGLPSHGVRGSLVTRFTVTGKLSNPMTSNH